MGSSTCLVAFQKGVRIVLEGAFNVTFIIDTKGLLVTRRAVHTTT